MQKVVIVREEWSVMWNQPGVGAWCDNTNYGSREGAEVVMAETDWPGSRVVHRTVTTTAWVSPPTEAEPGAPQARSIPDGRDV